MFRTLIAGGSPARVRRASSIDRDPQAGEYDIGSGQLDVSLPTSLLVSIVPRRRGWYRGANDRRPRALENDGRFRPDSTLTGKAQEVRALGKMTAHYSAIVKSASLVAAIVMLTTSWSFAESNDDPWTQIGGVLVKSRSICTNFRGGDKARAANEISWLIRNSTNEKVTVRVVGLSLGSLVKGRWRLKKRIPIVETLTQLDWRAGENVFRPFLGTKAQPVDSTLELRPNEQVLHTTKFALLKVTPYRDVFKLRLRVGEEASDVEAETTLCVSAIGSIPSD